MTIMNVMALSSISFDIFDILVIIDHYGCNGHSSRNGHIGCYGRNDIISIAVMPTISLEALVAALPLITPMAVIAVMAKGAVMAPMAIMAVTA